MAGPNKTRILDNSAPRPLSICDSPDKVSSPDEQTEYSFFGISELNPPCHTGIQFNTDPSSGLSASQLMTFNIRGPEKDIFR